MDKYSVSGMTCAACQVHVENAVNKVDGVESVTVSLLTNSMSVEGTAKPDKIIKAVESAGYGATLQGNNEIDLEDKETPKLAKRLIYSAIVLLFLMYLTMGCNMFGFPIPSFLEEKYIVLAIIQMVLSLVIMIINRAFFISGIKSTIKKAPNMDSLVSLGSGVSFVYSVYVIFKMTCVEIPYQMDIYHNGLYFESAAMIPTLITVGKILESYSKGKTTNALKNLLKMTPKTATILKDENEVVIPVDQVFLGDVFIVKPGESIPVDGKIISGTTAVDESALTGESIPVDKQEGDNVFSATINKNGYFKARATKVGKDTTFSQIIQMVCDASTTKAPIARIADKVSAVFVPSVILISIIVFIIWMIVERNTALALTRAITVLVISCPCALGLATPVAIMVGNGVGAKNGILFKTSEALENAGKTQIVVLDKTGTITKGKPSVTDILPSEGVDKELLLGIAFSLEKMSEHPLSYAIVKKAEDLDIKDKEVTDFKVLSGNGLEGKIEGLKVCGGSLKYISSIIELDEDDKEKCMTLSQSGKTPLLFALSNKLLGIIAVADEIKEESKKGIKELQNLGLKVVMLTGDNKYTASAIAKDTGVDRVVSEVLPNEKEEIIKRLQTLGKVAMVGDGINDAVALMRADTGIAIGNGTDVAIDSADIVLMNSKITDVFSAIRLSKRTIINIYENLFWAFAYNIILIPVAAGVFSKIQISPMLGAAAMAVSSFTVVMNALRLNLFSAGKYKNKEKKSTIDITNIDLSIKNIDNIQDKESNIMTKTVKVNGMMCAHCEAAVKKALESMDEIVSATPSHEENNVVIEMSSEVPSEDIEKIITELGYEYIGE